MFCFFLFLEAKTGTVIISIAAQIALLSSSTPIDSLVCLEILLNTKSVLPSTVLDAFLKFVATPPSKKKE